MSYNKGLSVSDVGSSGLKFILAYLAFLFFVGNGLYWEHSEILIEAYFYVLVVGLVLIFFLYIISSMDSLHALKALGIHAVFFSFVYVILFVDWTEFGLSKEEALHQAIKNENAERVESLLNTGADKNIKTGKWNDTPLHIAVILRNQEIVKVLINFEADVDAKDIFGSTPLHDSAFYNEYEITKLILSKAIDVNAIDNDGNTPFELARKRGHANIANLLRKHGGKTSAELKAEGK